MATQTPFRIYGSEMSPYSVKVRSYFRYKGLPHQWLMRNASNQADYQKHAKIPLIPLVVTPDDEGIQDSTPIIERVEAVHPHPSIHPGRTRRRVPLGAARGVRRRVGQQVDVPLPLGARRRSAERGRAHRPPDAAARGSNASMPRRPHRSAARMVDRVWFVGSNETTAPQIEASFERAIDLLEAHFADASVSVRRTSGVRRFRSVGHSSTVRGPIRRRVR